MTYITGTLTDSNAPATLYGTMATALAAAGYTLVDTVVISTRTHKVWKSAAANNAAALDWYIDIAYTTTGAGSIWWMPFENYDAATDTGFGGIVTSSSTIVDAASGTRFGTAVGYTLEHANWDKHPGITTGFQCPATSFGYWISITGDRIIGLSSQAPSNMPIYGGLYDADPLYAAKAGVKLFPLLAYGDVYGLTRCPPLTITGVNGWGYLLYTTARPDSGEIQVHMPGLPVDDTSAYPPTAARLALLPNFAGVRARVRWGWPKDMVQLNTVTPGVVRGDTITIDGAPWVLNTTASNLAYAFKAA